MFANYLEAAIVLLIMAGMGLLIWRGGAKNPVGTGGLDRKLARVEIDVKSVSEKVDEIERRVEDIDNRAAKASDIKRLEKQLEAHARKTDAIASQLAESREDLAGLAAEVQGSRRQLDLLYQFIVEKGMKS